MMNQLKDLIRMNCLCRLRVLSVDSAVLMYLICDSDRNFDFSPLTSSRLLVLLPVV